MKRDDWGVVLMVALALVVWWLSMLCGTRLPERPRDIFREWSQPDSHPERIPGGLDL